jgi:C_GCAxxG_C_C family probable redox protein
VLAVGEHLLGEVSTDTLKMASIFAGGVAGTRQELCGALSAGAMVVGALHGRTRPGEDEKKARELVGRFRERFLAEFGTTQCAPIRERFEVPGKTGFCAPVTERAVEILLEVLAAEGE